MIYIGYYFIVNPLKPGVEILIAELGAVGFESFVETDTGLSAFIQKSDWFSALDQKRFDAILSNPPYLEENDPHLLQGLEDEPVDALVSGPFGTEAIHHIIENAKNHIKPSGWLFIEHGYNQAKILKDLFEKNGYQHIENAKDIHGVHRVTFGQYSIV